MINSDFQNKSRVRNVKYVKLISRYITNLVIILNTHYRVASIKLPKGSKKIITVWCNVRLQITFLGGLDGGICFAVATPEGKAERKRRRLV